MPHPTQIPRRQSRGLRPWFLIPKVLCVAIFFGSLVTAMLLQFRQPTESDLLSNQQQIAFLFRYLILPSLAAILVLSIALLLQAPRPFLRMRWLQLKLLLLALLLPMISVANRSRTSLALLVSGFTIVIILGRLKPRLFQNWARTWRSLHSN